MSFSPTKVRENKRLEKKEEIGIEKSVKFGRSFNFQIFGKQRMKNSNSVDDLKNASSVTSEAPPYSTPTSPTSFRLNTKEQVSFGTSDIVDNVGGSFQRRYRRKIPPMIEWTQNTEEKKDSSDRASSKSLTHDPEGLPGHNDDVILGRPLWQPLLLANPEKKQKRGRKETLAEYHTKQVLAKEISKTDRKSFTTNFMVERRKFFQLDTFNQQEKVTKQEREKIPISTPSCPNVFENERKVFQQRETQGMANLKAHLNNIAHPNPEVGIVNREKLFKVLLIGDPGVGKTSFVQRYTNDIYRSDYKGTVGVDFALKVLRVSRDTFVKLQLWDVAGQERFTWMTRVYYRDARGCIVMFDLTNRQSFTNIARWKKDLDTKCTLPDGSSVPCLLLASKCDLKDRQVDVDEIESVYKKLDFIGWTETSAKDDMMVRDSVKFLVDTMLKNDSSKGQNDEFDKNIRPKNDEEFDKTIRLNREILSHQKNCFMC